MSYKKKAEEVAKSFLEDGRICGVFQYLEQDSEKFIQYYTQKYHSVSFYYTIPQNPSIEAFIKAFLLEYTSSKKVNSTNLGKVITPLSIRKAQKLISPKSSALGLSKTEAAYLLSDLLWARRRLLGGFRRRFRRRLRQTLFIINLDHSKVGFSKKVLDFVSLLLGISYDFSGLCVVSSSKELAIPRGLITPEEYHASTFPPDASEYFFDTTQLPVRTGGSINILDKNLTVLDQFQPNSSKIEIDGQKYHQISDDVKILISRLGHRLQWVIVDIEDSFHPVFSNTLLPGITTKVKNKKTQETEFLVNFDCI